ncbi:deoxyribose-phosphate aldolase [Winogradskyella maritima]|uniref:Deoxyribose-phosphate aldolase n=1 Tax=Winogradskyella maritima TaxID=1517766 RepID=A0ABV8AGF0_9FLAO|nr:deoxyribose-phosphate aldolase [Winogradskyella maritima]
MELNSYIDHSYLKADATERDIIQLCEEALNNHFYSVCVNGCYVPIAHQITKRSDVKVCAVVGFPFGAMSTEAKVAEAKYAIQQGASEIDMVMNIGMLKSKNHVAVLRDITEVKRAIGNTPLKVIIEISELSKNEIVKACEICLDGKADYVKTSTGFAEGGATFTAVKIIKKTLKDRAKIKASGGIRDAETAMKFIDLGVDRIGTSSSVSICKSKLSIPA